MPHYPNPFDFVPFPSAPILHTEKQFDALGKKLSGYLELEIKALTPVHVVGRVEGGSAENQSFFFRQDNQPCIPASSIRGCLRAFTEALTAGWVSQTTPEYPKEYHGRHVGFKTFEDYDPKRSRRSRISPPAVVPAFKPGASSGELDVASYLFGTVVEGKQMEPEEQSRKSKVWVEDAYLPLEAIISGKEWWAPDIGGKAFMGGAKPSASNWWYFEPAEVWKRSLYDKNDNPLLDKFGQRQEVAEFIGDHFRGRKFYYHQNPVDCVKMYHPDNEYWDYPNNQFHLVRLECMRQDAVTQPFRIYMDGIPRSLFELLLRILHLQPEATMRHKIGYAKAYGYGSIEFVLKSAMLRATRPGIPKALQSINIVAGSWSETALAQYGLTDFIDRNALAWLACILGWPHGNLLFVYPRYCAKEFQQAIRYRQFKRELEDEKIPVADKMDVNLQDARAIAEALWDLKRPIEFRRYQERAKGWNTIVQRKP